MYTECKHYSYEPCTANRAQYCLPCHASTLTLVQSLQYLFFSTTTIFAAPLPMDHIDKMAQECMRDLDVEDGGDDDLEDEDDLLVDFDLLFCIAVYRLQVSRSALTSVVVVG